MPVIFVPSKVIHDGSAWPLASLAANCSGSPSGSVKVVAGISMANALPVVIVLSARGVARTGASLIGLTESLK
ncbi:hypothetical protein D9M69_661030 [compost metagenome]